MIPMKFVKFLSLLLLFCTSTALAFDIYEDVSNAIRSGDAKQLATYFGSSVDLTVLDQEDVYSKAQAELIVKDFFSKNPPKNFTLLHKGSSREGTVYGIGKLQTTNGKVYRTSFFLKVASGRYLVQELRFESE